MSEPYRSEPPETEPTPRQVLYALVAGGFLFVVAVLIGAAAISAIVPLWWTITMGVVLVAAGLWSGLNWRRTGPVLLVSIGLLVAWTIGTLISS